MKTSLFFKILISFFILIVSIFVTIKYKFPVLVEANASISSEIKSVFNYDFEKQLDLENYSNNSSTTSKSGQLSALLNDTIEFSTTFNKKSEEIINYKEVTEILVELQIQSNDTVKGASIVLSIEDENGKSIYWKASELSGIWKEWTLVRETFLFEGLRLNDHQKIKIYVWNRNKVEFYFDDLKINFNSPK